MLSTLQLVLSVLEHPSKLGSGSVIAAKLEPEALERAVSLLTENRESSRRVEFRVVTKSEKLIDEIEQLIEEFDK